MKTYIYTLIILILILACKENKTKKTLIGTWAIEGVDFLEEPMHLIRGDSNGIIELSFNLISLNEDETCRLPAILSHRNENDTRGTWSLLKKDEDYTIVITSNNIFFNGEFVIESLETTKMRGGHFYTMTLSNQLCVIELNRPVY